MRYLIADDEQLVRLTIQKILNDYGVDNSDICHAGTGEEMLAILASRHVDLAFVDIRMPGITGLKAIREGIRISRYTSFYILTGYDRFEYAREAVSIGVKDFLLKPLDPQAMGEILRRERTDRESLRRQLKREYLSLISSALLTGSASDGGSVSCLTCLCTFDGADTGLPEMLCRCEDTFSSVYAVKLSFPAKSYVFFCSRQPLPPKLLLAQVKTLFTAAGHSGQGEATVFCLSQAVPLSGLTDAITALEQYSSIRLLRGLGKFYTVFPGQTAKKDLNLAVCKQILQMKEDYGQNSYVDYMNHLEKFKISFSEVFPKLGLASLRQINRWLELCFFAPREFLDSPDRFYHYFQSLSAHLIAPVEQKTSSIETIIRYVDSNYTADISINGLADRFGLTPNYLSAQFKRETGTKFTDYITNLRIAHAKKLLLESNLQVKQIALEVGYYTASHFIKAFVRHEEITPLEYRNIHNNPASGKIL